MNSLMRSARHDPVTSQKSHLTAGLRPGTLRDISCPNCRASQLLPTLPLCPQDTQTDATFALVAIGISVSLALYLAQWSHIKTLPFCSLPAPNPTCVPRHCLSEYMGCYFFSAGGAPQPTLAGLSPPEILFPGLQGFDIARCNRSHPAAGFWSCV